MPAAEIGVVVVVVGVDLLFCFDPGGVFSGAFPLPADSGVPLLPPGFNRRSSRGRRLEPEVGPAGGGGGVVGRRVGSISRCS